jgi:hypothetical protein
MKHILALTMALTAAGCSVTSAPMPYNPTVRIEPDSTRHEQIRVDRVASERNEEPTWLGTIRGGYGNPLKVLHAAVPISQVVQIAFDDGLKARSLYAEPPAGGKLAFWVTVHTFEAGQFVRRDANVDFSVSLTDRATGRTLWHDRQRVSRLDGSIVAFDVGIFASPDDLRAVAPRAMSEAVDTLLDKPEFRAALR